ncbi:MAG: copper chaperone PCu(A)C [Halothiobacillaceae bacterium]|jgi:copper(I)-binding protein|nr:copper chaperone PCu(A)C [Halothiobacillaceae bacterium]
MFHRPLVALTLSALLGASPTLWAATAADSVRVDDPYVRLMPPGQPNTAAFMVLENTDGADHAVVSAESPAAKVVELHTHTHEDGMMKMRQIPRIDIPGMGVTTLQPGGLHVMLIDLVAPLAADQTVDVTLVFEDGSRKTLKAPTRRPGGQMPMPGAMGH